MAAGSEGAIVAMRFAEAGWMVFLWNARCGSRGTRSGDDGHREDSGRDVQRG